MQPVVIALIQFAHARSAKNGASPLVESAMPALP